MTLEGFDEWDKENKTKYPIRFFLQETLYGSINIWYYQTVTTRYEKIYWAVVHRLFKRHQYHIIRPRTLKPNYCDQDTRILHAVMECFVGYYENNMDNMDDIEYPPEDNISKVHIEMVEIYDWWIHKYPERETITIDGKSLTELPTLPAAWGGLPMLRQKYNEEPLMKEWVLIAAQHSKNKTEWYEKETEILERIIKIRQNLWD